MRRQDSGSPAPAGAPKRFSTRARTVTAALAGIAVAAAIGIAAQAAGPDRARAGQPTMPDLGPAPSYTLTDQNGRPFASAALRGKVQVVSYLFPYCTSFCPLLAGSLVRAQAIMERDGLASGVAFVAFNVDPLHAGPDTMAAFLRQEQVNPDDPSWHFLTGSAAAVRQVVTDGFHVFYQQVSVAEEERTEAEQRAAGTYTPQPTAPNALADRAKVTYDIAHNDVVEIVDPHGTIRTILSSDSVPTPEEVVAAVRNALTLRE